MFRAPPLPRTLEAALRDATDGKPAVRADAVRQLAPHAEVAREQVVRTLEKALRDEAPAVRAAAAASLADVASVDSLPALLIAVEDDDALVRQMAITALGEIGDPRATERLRRALNDERAEVRFQAAMAFPRVTASRDDAIEALVHATHDADPLVCHIALRMAEELSTNGETVRPVDPRVLARARVLVKDGADEVRIVSAILLARSGERAAEAVLAKVARSELKTRDPEDEAAAIELAGELGIKGATAGLERRAFGNILGFRRDRFAWHARVALARMGHERACRDILTELGASDRDVRTMAVAAAGRARLMAAREPIAAMQGNATRADPHAVEEALATLAGAEEDA